jgi:hypothetical protein
MRINPWFPSPPGKAVLIFAAVFAALFLRTEAAMIAHYPLDGNAQDVGTNGLHGIVNGSPQPIADRLGLSSSALRLNGSTDFLDLQNPPQFNFTEDFTIACWFRADFLTDGYLIAKHSTTVPGPPNSYGLGTGAQTYAFVSHAASPTGYFDTGGGPLLDDNRWHFAAFTYEGSFGLRLYVDGEQVGEAAAANAPPFTNSLPLLIGKATFGRSFNGAVDEVTIYDRALTRVEIRELFEAPVSLQVLEQPKDAFVEVGTNAVFTINLGGTNATSVSYQWYVDNSPINGATNASYTTEIYESPTRRAVQVRFRLGDREWASAETLLMVSPSGQRGLLARWTFDDPFESVITDSTGNYPGENHNGLRVQGFVGAGALSLNGTNAYVFVGGQNTPISLTNSQYTLSWWQKWNGEGIPYQNVLAMDDGMDYSGGYQVYIPHPQDVLGYVHSDGIIQRGVSGWGFADDIWRFYAVTYDGQSLQLYTDGVLVGSEERSFPIRQDGDDPLVLGGLALEDGRVTNFFNGSLDDIRIYARALSAAEIQELGPEPETIIRQQPQSFRLAQGQTITLRVEITARVIPTTPPEFTYQWELDGVPVPGATNRSLTVTANGGLKRYRLLIKAAGLQIYTDEATIETIIPSGGNRLLLHLDFEENDRGRFYDRTNGIVAFGTNVTLVPGRVRRYAAAFSGDGYIRVPAAGTDLEMVGTSYTIAWWMKSDPDTSQPYYIFTIGPRDLAGYGVRLEGGRLSRFLRFDHRRGVNSVMNSAYRATNWIHLAVVYDGVRRTVYQNGVAANVVNTSGSLAGSGQDDLFIGADELGNTYPFGAMDDFRIYNYALVADKIRELANVPLPDPRLVAEPVGPNIQIRWPLSEQTQYRVEYSSGLGAEAVWTPVGTPAEATAYFHQMVQPATNQFRFYRLRKL